MSVLLETNIRKKRRKRKSEWEEEMIEKKIQSSYFEHLQYVLLSVTSWKYLTKNMNSFYWYIQFTEKEAGAQGGYITC